MDRAIARWAEIEGRESVELTKKIRESYEHRLCHHVISAAIAAGHVPEAAVAQTNGKRASAKAWGEFKRLFEGPLRSWALDTLAAYLDTKEAESLGPDDPPADYATAERAAIREG